MAGADKKPATLRRELVLFPVCSEDDPAQGWKLHVSATILSAVEVFVRAEPILRKNDALFKVPCRLELLKALNSWPS